MTNCLILTHERLSPGADASARGWALVFAALARMTGRTYRNADVQRSSRGRPFIPGAPSFSITHCEGLVAAAVLRDGLVGIDAEPHARPTARVMRKICDAEELRLAESESPAWVWVAKEAGIKCLGLSALMGGQVRVWPEHVAMRNQLLFLRRPLLAEGFACAVASSLRIADNQMQNHHD